MLIFDRRVDVVILLFAIVIRDRFDGIVKFCGSLVTS
jgi:hypothetical protein